MRWFSYGRCARDCSLVLEQTKQRATSLCITVGLHDQQRLSKYPFALEVNLKRTLGRKGGARAELSGERFAQRPTVLLKWVPAQLKGEPSEFY